MTPYHTTSRFSSSPSSSMSSSSMRGHDLNYFTCTLGQAAIWNEKHPHRFQTVNDLVNEQAECIPHAPAVGFAALPKMVRYGPWEKGFLTYSEIKDYSITVAARLAHVLQLLGDRQTRTVALLSASSPEFVLAWLGLMRLGLSVLLIAPQSHPSAIEHLCKKCNAVALFTDENYAEKAELVEGDVIAINISRITRVTELDPSVSISGTSKPTDVAYFHHTSGTSTGLPKPIPQSHNAAVGVLPCFIDGETSATFSTTPLYHGGVADTFRAWASGSMIWLFPEGYLPIMEDTIRECLEFVDSRSSAKICPRVRYFSSVPYILQMLAEDQRGLDRLKKMDIVGVGGAALPAPVGNDLVKNGVNLISRFGSAECGFLISSNRDFENDKIWDYLRPGVNSRLLSFEPREQGLWELVIKTGWPHMAKTNRDDGSYATSDLFEPHPEIAQAWRYHSRADAQITLITGKKFDPAPVEAAILASSPELRDVLVFGNGKTYPGALLFPAGPMSVPEAFLDQLWASIEHLNGGAQGHARIPRTMLVVVEADPATPVLEKSSKGTILRRQAEKRYAAQIEEAYKGRNTGKVLGNGIADKDIVQELLTTVEQIVGRPICIDGDLFGQGVDSVACVQIRGWIETRLLPNTATPLPLNLVYDCGSIRALGEFVLKRRRGQRSQRIDEISLMSQLVEQYTQFESRSPAHQAIPNDAVPAHVVVLTGATGALGAHILHLLRQNPKVSKIYCLLRAHTSLAAFERVTRSLQARGKPGLDPFEETSLWDKKVVCLQCKLSDPELGLSQSSYANIASSATHIIHAAWAVNFSLRLKSFIKDHIAGTRHLIDLAVMCSKGARFIFTSSTASVSASETRPISESLSRDPSEASSLGYSRSKWVAEGICAAAHSRYYSPDLPGPSFSILRVGQLCGDTINGIWNASEAYPLMLSSASITESLPDLEHESLNWLPVDLAAKAIIEVLLGAADTNTSRESVVQDSIPVYHILNPHTVPTWREMLDYIQDELVATRNGRELTIIQPGEWVQLLEQKLNGTQSTSHADASAAGLSSRNDTSRALDHPARSLLSLWTSSYSSPSLTPVSETVEAGTHNSAVPSFSIEDTAHVSEIIQNVKPLDRESVLEMWRWIQANVGRKT